jgi:hypothetical protein
MSRFHGVLCFRDRLNLSAVFNLERPANQVTTLTGYFPPTSLLRAALVPREEIHMMAEQILVGRGSLRFAWDVAVDV